MISSANAWKLVTWLSPGVCVKESRKKNPKIDLEQSKDFGVEWELLNSIVFASTLFFGLSRR